MAGECRSVLGPFLHPLPHSRGSLPAEWALHPPGSSRPHTARLNLRPHTCWGRAWADPAPTICAASRPSLTTVSSSAEAPRAEMSSVDAVFAPEQGQRNGALLPLPLTSQLL